MDAIAEHAEPPPLPDLPRRRSFWRSPVGCLAIVGIGIGTALMAIIAAYAIGMATGRLPDSKAIPGRRVTEHVLELLRENDIIDAGEGVLYLYSAGILSFREDGNLFTDRRVISYWEEPDGTLEVYAAPYVDIERFEVEWSTSVLDDTIITVHLLDGGEFDLWVSQEDGRDHEFHDLLVATWQRSR